MKSEFECIPCILRQTIEATRLSVKNENQQRLVINKVLHFLQNANYEVSPPELGKYIFDIICETTGNNDPYRELKIKYNKFALEKYGLFKKLIYLHNDPVLLAAKLAVSGNLIDFSKKESEHQISRIIENIHKMEFLINDYHLFMEDILNAKNILYLTDNAGEIVFDKIFIEVLQRFYPERAQKFTVVVRGAPIINDATMDDALLINLDAIASVIDNGDRAPATVLHNVSKEMKKYYDNADLIISKGQGNFETLHNEEKLIYFMFRIKCPIIAKELNLTESGMVLKRNKTTLSV